MNCIVTAGPTYEPLDQVRRLTNFSTGQLGSDLASFLTAQGHQVTLWLGYYAIYRGAPNADVVQFTTTEDLRFRLQQLALGDVGAVFHAAAVSDFRFGRVFEREPNGELTELRAGKISTRQGSLLAELVPTGKILASLRSWYPNAWLAGWKYEVDGSREDAINKGRAQMTSCVTDACVVNGPAFGPGYGLLLAAEKNYLPLADAPALFQALFAALGKDV